MQPDPSQRQQAPIHRDATRLAIWVLDTFESSPRPSAQRCCRQVCELLESVGLALFQSGHRRRHLDDADNVLQRLRLGIRLAQERGLLSQEQLIHFTELAVPIGRQLSGWRKHGATE